MKNLILASTSTIYGSDYLAYILPVFKETLGDIKEVLFIPFARPGGISHDNYTALAAKAFKTIDVKIVGIHTFENMQRALRSAEAIFTGGGNTFLLVDKLYKQKLISTLKDVVNNGTIYFGTSAGSNIGGVSMQTTNDMPIIYPPSFDTCAWIPYNINPHYLDPDPHSKHKGETRETRINEFHTLNDTPVIGLREGNWLEVKGEKITVKGPKSTRFFEKSKEAIEVDPNHIF